jgi:hypothetical protein
MRHHFAGRARDTYGNVQGSVPVYVYYTGTTSAAPIYTTYDGETLVIVAPQITTNSAGYFDFYVDDTEIIPGTLFDILCEGITYDKIDIFKNAWFNPKKYFVL